MATGQDVRLLQRALGRSLPESVLAEMYDAMSEQEKADLARFANLKPMSGKQ